MNFCRARGRSRYCRTLQGSTGHHRITAGHQAYRIPQENHRKPGVQDNRRTPRLQDTTGQPQDTRPTGYHRITAGHQAYRIPQDNRRTPGLPVVMDDLKISNLDRFRFDFF